jgi:hypothetical protein
MSDSVKRHLNSLSVLSEAPKKLRKAVIDNSNKEVIQALCEVIHNVLEGTVKLTPADIRKLKYHNKTLIRLTQKSTSLKKKKEIIGQKGGFLLTLLPPALALLATLINAAR